MRKIFLAPENLACLVVFLLPTYLVRFSVFHLPTNLLEIIIGFVFCIWLYDTIKNNKKIRLPFNPGLARLVGSRAYAGQKILKHKTHLAMLDKFLKETKNSTTGIAARVRLTRKSCNKKYILPIFMIFLGFLLSTLLNHNILKGLGIIKSWFIVPLIFTVIAKNSLEKPEKIFDAYFLSAVFVSLVSLFYLLLGKLTFDNRLEAFWNSPNYLAMYLAPAIIIGALKEKDFKMNTSLIILLLVLFFTFSYSTWISISLALLLVFFLQKEILFKKIFFVLTLVILFFLTQIYSQKFIDLATLQSRSSFSSRVMIWKSALFSLKENWIFGIGPGNFQENYLANQKYFPPYLEWAVPHPHNIFLAFWLFGGLLAFMGFLWLMFLFFKDVLFLIKNNASKDFTYRYMALGIMFYILIHGLVDTTYFKNDLAIVFWLNFLIL